MSEDRENAVAAVDRLLRHARAQNASDLHLDPSHQGLVVRMRRDGALLPVEVLPRSLSRNVVGRVKALADLLVYRTDVPQEGLIARHRNPAESSGDGAEPGSAALGSAALDCDVRVSTYPAALGERISLRLVAREAAAPALADLGLPADICSRLQGAIEQPDGVVLLTGPSGSGKTTTLYSCLEHLAAQPRQRSILTVEDPVEHHLPGVTQTEVNPTVGLDFPTALRSLLRQDPEVILIGEVRDRETAAMALEAGLTGHLVVSTVHAGSSSLVFARLLEMGVEPFVLTTVVRGVLAQRLVRTTCQSCPDQSGCEACAHTGWRGRMLLAEWLPMSADLRQAILSRADGDQLARVADSAGLLSLADAAAQALREGRTTAEEVRHALGDV